MRDSLLPAPAARDLRRALAGRTPTIPPRWFWDATGARLHRERTRLPGHYPTHVERELVQAHAPVLIGLYEPVEVADLAPAASRHVRSLADAMLQNTRGGRCALLDADPARLVASVRRLAADYPRLDVRGAVGDWRGGGWRLGGGGARLLLLSGVGPDGLDPTVLPMLLRTMARRLGRDDTLLLGVDLGRDPVGLVRACDDPEGLAAAFHRNALRALNAQVGADFDPEAFRFEARWDAGRRRVETRLRPMRAGRVALPGIGMVMALDPTRPLVTGRVGTWTREGLRDRVTAAGLELSAWLADPDERRALAVLRRRPSDRVRAHDL